MRHKGSKRYYRIVWDDKPRWITRYLMPGYIGYLDCITKDQAIRHNMQLYTDRANDSLNCLKDAAQKIKQIQELCATK